MAALEGWHPPPAFHWAKLQSRFWGLGEAEEEARGPAAAGP